MRMIWLHPANLTQILFLQITQCKSRNEHSYEILTKGQRELMAALELGLDDIPVIFVEHLSENEIKA